MKRCSIDGCSRPYYAKGLCGTHYQRNRLLGSPEDSALKKPRGSIDERFWPKVDKGGAGGCWEWIGGKTERGYGVLQAGGRGSKLLLAHRISYEVHKGPIPDGLLILHSCDNPSCVNPDHLRAGTNQENIAEAFTKKRKTAPISFGESNPRSKITAEQARFIKAHPELQHTELASLFGVSPNCIRSVRIGRTWKD